MARWLVDSLGQCLNARLLARFGQATIRPGHCCFTPPNRPSGRARGCSTEALLALMRAPNRLNLSANRAGPVTIRSTISANWMRKPDTTEVVPGVADAPPGLEPGLS